MCKQISSRTEDSALYSEVQIYDLSFQNETPRAFRYGCIVIKVGEEC